MASASGSPGESWGGRVEPPNAPPSNSRALPAASARLWVWFGAALVTLVHVGLKVPGLGRDGLWLDEAVAVHLGQLHPARLLAAVQHDTSPPLYYLLLSGWERLFGISEVAVRWPSVLASALTGGVLYVVAHEAGGRFVAWCSSALFLASAANLRFAHQARPYAMTTLLCCIALGLLLRAMEKPTWLRLCALTAVNTLAFYTHYLSALAVVAQLVALSAPWRGWARVRRFALAHAVIGAAFLPWLAAALRTETGLMGWLAIPGLHELLGLLGWYAGRSVPLFFLVSLAAAAAVALARSCRARPPWQLVPSALWVVVPIVLAMAVSHHVSCFHERYLLYVTPALSLAWALAFSVLEPRIGAAAAALASAALAARLGVAPGSPSFEWREAAAAARSARADRVVLIPGYESATFAYYFDPAAFRDAEHTAERLAGDGMSFADAGAISRVDLAGVRRLVVVQSPPPDDGARDRVRRDLEVQGFVMRSRRGLAGIAVSILER